MQFEQIKPTWKDWIVILTFGIFMLMTLDARISIPLTLLMAFIISLYEYFNKKPINKQKMKSSAKKIMFVVFLLIIIDTISTYYAVHWVGFAYEKNKILLLLWDNFGVIGGEIIRYHLIAFLFIVNFYHLNSNHKKQFLLGYFMPFFYLFLWSFVVINNLYHILSFHNIIFI